MLVINQKKFFEGVRKDLFGGRLTESQVQGMQFILAEAALRKTKLTYLAYMLATTYHETAKTMMPIEEYGKGKGRPYGNKDPKTGHAYYGRGYVQLTWKANYERASKALGVDFVGFPRLVMVPQHAAEIMFTGMEEGWFTGRKLSDYDRPKFDAVGARRIINGRNRTRHAQGLDHDADYDTVIARYYDKFLAALEYVEEVEHISHPPASTVIRPDAIEPPAPPAKSLLVRIFLAILGAFKK